MEVGKTFSSFAQFEEFFVEYQRATNQLFVVKSSKSTESANKRDVNAQLKDELKYSYIHYQCKHGGEARHKGVGLRPIQKTRKLQCSALVVLTADRRSQKLCVTKVELTHNHEVSSTVYAHYPENRRLTEQEKRDLVAPAVDLHVKPALLRHWIQQKTGKLVTAKDVQNIVAEISTKNKSDADLLADEVSEMLRTDPDAEVAMHIEESGLLQIVYFQTGRMKSVFESFPEVVLLDGTYRTNSLKMPLYAFAVVDGNGVAHVVAYALMVSDGKELIRATLETFVKANPATRDTRCVIVDDDFKDIDAIRQIFPRSVSVQLGEFHVTKALKRAIAAHHSEPEKKEKLMALFSEMLYSEDEATYEAFKSRFESEANDDMRSYFNSNWDGTKEMWVRHVCNRHFNLGDNATNRMEPHNQKLKSVLTRSTKLHAAIRSVLMLHTAEAKEAEQSHARNCASMVYNRKTDSGLSKACAANLTLYAARKVLEEELKAKAMKDIARVASDSEGRYLVSTDREAYDVAPGLTSCTCFTYTTTALVCRHIVLASWSMSREIDILQTVSRRWLKSRQLLVIRADEAENSVPDATVPAVGSVDSVPDITVSSVDSVDHEKASRTAKYYCALRILKELAHRIAECDSREFEKRIKTVKQLAELWAGNWDVELCATAVEAPPSCRDSLGPPEPSQLITCSTSVSSGDEESPGSRKDDGSACSPQQTAPSHTSSARPDGPTAPASTVFPSSLRPASQVDPTSVNGTPARTPGSTRRDEYHYSPQRERRLCTKGAKRTLTAEWAGCVRKLAPKSHPKT